eukprot:TRINITY_DN1149_c0_g1_i10.p1 TRINITY_DN1149_c0_g1~~TRINITY_DN1149_c0_g1_i10.p1  ORF type:complete len:430 (-),score=42.12 TRINITY_DN1149_c0_g1_i10:3293-4582(-)
MLIQLDSRYNNWVYTLYVILQQAIYWKYLFQHEDMSSGQTLGVKAQRFRGHTDKQVRQLNNFLNQFHLSFLTKSFDMANTIYFKPFPQNSCRFSRKSLVLVSSTAHIQKYGYNVRSQLICYALAQGTSTGVLNGHRSDSSNLMINEIPPAGKIVKFGNIKGDDFRHPYDQKNTQFLRKMPGLEMLAKNLMSPVAEQVLLLENISTSVKVGPKQLPSMYQALREATNALDMEMPELYIRQNPVPNAYTLAISGRKPFIVIHTSLAELLTPQELKVVIAHELGHLKCDHGVWLTVANLLASRTVSILPIITGPVEEELFRWLRAAELTCDRAALLVTQDVRLVISTLMKLTGGTRSLANELNVDAFLQQARSYEEVTNNPLGWFLRHAQTRALSHPLPVLRAREIDDWSNSGQYKSLITKNRSNRFSKIQT